MKKILGMLVAVLIMQSFGVFASNKVDVKDSCNNITYEKTAGFLALTHSLYRSPLIINGILTDIKKACVQHPNHTKAIRLAVGAVFGVSYGAGTYAKYRCSRWFGRQFDNNQL